MLQTQIEVVQNDKLYELDFTLQDSAGIAVDISNATLVFKAQTPGASAAKFSGSMVIISGAAGTCKYVVQPTDFDTAGKLYAEIQATFLSGEVMTWPGIVVTVDPELPQ